VLEPGFSAVVDDEPDLAAVAGQRHREEWSEDSRPLVNDPTFPA
jgi:hypothetical protein